MKRKLIFLLITVAILLSLSYGVYAVYENRTAELAFRDIKISLNGNEFIPKDANGKTVEPFIIDGTTYLPVRGVAEALGLLVDWDGDTFTVMLSVSEDAKPVFITATGKRYHYDEHCNGGTYWEVPMSSAIGMGLTPCDKCVLKVNSD